MKPKSFVRIQKFFDQTTFTKIIIAYILLILLFGIFFYLLSSVPKHGLFYQSGKPIGEGAWKMLDAVYFSFITATSTGYGDIVPQGFSRVVAIIEVFGGLLIFGIIISKFVSVKQETILQEVYDISFDERINRLRSALYLYRTDTNRFFERVKSNAMGRREVDDLWVHFTSLDVTLTDISKIILQRAKAHTKAIDPFMLELLLNSVDLSLNKTYRLVSLLVEKGYPWKSPLTLQHLTNIIHASRRIITFEEYDSIPKTARAKLSEMKQIVEALQAVIEGKAQPLSYKNLQDYGTKREGR